MENESRLVIHGARANNLKNIHVSLPREKLIVISGLSGSGKSSLAFDTIFAEGQRRYVESLSSYARQFLGVMDKPDVDYIDGLSPAISIEQKTTHNNPRSTVGTITEIYDYYRLLFARIGMVHCPQCGKEIQEQSVDQIIDAILKWKVGTKIQILAPIIKGKKGEHQKILDDAKKAGFARARIDGLVTNLDETIKLDKQKKHSIEIIVDRIKVSSEARQRIAEAVETALNNSAGILLVTKQEEEQGKIEEVFFSQKNACPDCGISIPELSPRLFSFNSPFGACPECMGLGEKSDFDIHLIIPDFSCSFNEGGFAPIKPQSAWNRAQFEGLARTYGFSLDEPISYISKKVLDIILYGSKSETIQFEYERSDGSGRSKFNKAWEGIIPLLHRRQIESWSETQKQYYERYKSSKQCKTCNGKRLKQEALSVTIGNKTIYELSSLSVGDTITFFNELVLTDTEKKLLTKY